jgi:hypothetical protein
MQDEGPRQVARGSLPPPDPPSTKRMKGDNGAIKIEDN